jgi:hypothetical protein
VSIQFIPNGTGSRSAQIGVVAANAGVSTITVSGNGIAQTPVTYGFNGTLATALNGSTAVTGFFTLDYATQTVTTFSLTTPAGVFNNSHTRGSVTECTASGACFAPTTPFIGVAFVGPDGGSIAVMSLLFQGSLASFRAAGGGPLLLSVPNGGNGGLALSGLTCSITSPGAALCPTLFSSTFASGVATGPPQ